MSLLLRIAERALNRPLLVHPDKVPLLIGLLDGRIPLGDTSALKEAADDRIDELPPEAQQALRGPKREASRFAGGSYEDTDPVTGERRSLPYKRTKDGVAIIPVIGSLINRGAWIGSYSGEVSYEGLKFQIGSAARDPRTRAILLDIESPGGEAVGAFEAADVVREAAKTKTVVAVANGMMASAAYALASGATKIVTTASGVVGSIGVVMLHADFSRALDKRGITPTFIFAGAHKVDGNQFEPLPADVRADLQREVEQVYTLFIQTVAAGRPSLTEQAVRATEARVFIGEEAVKAGLADEVGTFESALSQLSEATARSWATLKGSLMSKTEGQPAAENAGNTVTLEAHSAAVEKAKTDARAEGKAEGLAEGRKAEQARLSAILGDEKVKGKEATALSLAMKSPDMKAEDVVSFVATLPAAAPSIEQRLNGQGEALALGQPMQQPTAARGGWDKAVAKANAQRGLN